MDRKTRILQKIDELEPDLVNWATEIVRFPTLSGQEQEAQAYVQAQLQALDFDQIDVWEPDFNELKGHEAFSTSRTDFKGSSNVVGIKQGQGGGRSLILNSHIDVVPEGDHRQWTHSPFGGIVDKGRIFGRGISDMKGTKAAMFTVLKAFKELGLHLRGDLILQSVIEEESGGAGSLACSLRGYRADAAIIPEPSGFSICPAQQGATWFRVRVPGLSAHGGQRYMGVSAIENFVQLFPAVLDVEAELNSRYANPLYADVPIPFTINVGTVRSGGWPSTVPEEVLFEGRMGVPPGLSLKAARAWLEKGLAEAAGKDPWLVEHPPQVEWWGAFWGSAQIEATHPIVRAAERAFSSIRGEAPQIAGTPWGTDARMLTELAQTPTLIFGPGVKAHCPDESLAIADLHSYAKMLALILIDWCGVDQ